MILTVPESWLTVSNGKLVNVASAGQGMKGLDVAPVEARVDVPDFGGRRRIR